MLPRPNDLAALPGLQQLWHETVGDSRVRIAVLDGPVDASHPAFCGARIDHGPGFVRAHATGGMAIRHGTHVASVIFGQPESPVRGIAPGCTGMVIPIYTDSSIGSARPCSQIDLARALNLALQNGAHIINVSGGQNMPSGEAYPLLARVVRQCAEQGVLIVAAAGNDGCECLHIPGSLPSVLAVGAMGASGEPLPFSNWGKSYRQQGVLGPGEWIEGAVPGGGVAAYSGTSFATAVVSGVVGLLASLQLKRGIALNVIAIRDAILQSAQGCDSQDLTLACRRLLAGRIDLAATVALLQRGAIPMPEVHSSPEPDLPPPVAPVNDSESFAVSTAVAAPAEQQTAGAITPGLEVCVPSILPAGLPVPSRSETTHVTRPHPTGEALMSDQATVSRPGIEPSGCGCGGSGPTQLIYALGTIGYDLGTEARRASITENMGDGKNPANPNDLLDYLDENPWDAQAITWTLQIDSVPIYALSPQGPFAAEGYQRILRFLREQQETERAQRVEIVAVPAYGSGKSVTLQASGATVPVIHPEIRGMASWNKAALVRAVIGELPEKSTEEQRNAARRRIDNVGNFLDRVYFDLRNLGMTPQERAINYAATNAFHVERIFERAIQDDMQLDSIGVERSPICRPDSDCWDVKLNFFYPFKPSVQPARVMFETQVYRFTVDVSDVVPVMIGGMKSWFVR